MTMTRRWTVGVVMSWLAAVSAGAQTSDRPDGTCPETAGRVLDHDPANASDETAAIACGASEGFF